MIVVPVLVKQRAVNLIYAHTLGGPPPQQLVTELTDLARPRADLVPAADPAGPRVVIAAREQARAYLRAGTSFAWNATHLTSSLRERADARSATASGAHRADRREPVPAAVVERMQARWTVPDPSEAHEVTHAIPATPARVAWPPTPQDEPAVKPRARAFCPCR